MQREQREQHVQRPCAEEEPGEFTKAFSSPSSCRT